MSTDRGTAAASTVRPAQEPSAAANPDASRRSPGTPRTRDHCVEEPLEQLVTASNIDAETSIPNQHTRHSRSGQHDHQRVPSRESRLVGRSELLDDVPEQAVGGRKEHPLPQVPVAKFDGPARTLIGEPLRHRRQRPDLDRARAAHELGE
jgi:hypothetical protein